LADIFSELNFISQPLARFQLRRGAQCGGPAQVPMRCPRAVECESRHDGLAFVSSPHAELGRDPAPDPNQRPEPRPWLQSDIPETDPSARVSSAEAEPSLGECLEPQRATLDHFDADEVSELTFLRKVRAKAEAAAIAVFPDRPRHWGRAVPRDAQLEAAGCRRREPNSKPARAEIPNGAFDEPQAVPGKNLGRKQDALLAVAA